jgi:L-asparaginase/Glu-tRNA(Gln) amidotransferase subunit D
MMAVVVVVVVMITDNISGSVGVHTYAVGRKLLNFCWASMLC